MSNNALTTCSETGSIPLPAEQATAQAPWTRTQQRLLAVLQHQEHQQAPIAKICQLAGYAGSTIWHAAIKDERFVAAIQALGFICTHHGVSRPQRRLLAVLEQPEHRKKSGAQICQLAGYKVACPWQRAIKDEHFVAAVEALGVTIKRHHLASHLEVEPATNLEEELAKDVWDMRRLKPDYPKHVAPSTFEVDFSWILNPVLREQVKCYFRHQLTRWKAATFPRALHHIKTVLVFLPPHVHVETLQRSDLEALLPALNQFSEYQAGRGLFEAKTMFDYMATSPAWTGPRPPRFLIWKEDIPRYSQALPRPIPPAVLDQFDPLLDQAAQAMKVGWEPPIIAPMLWDVLLILRHTGMRFEDLAHLKAPDAHGRNGCLEQDAEGYWWIRIDHTHTKMGKDHRIPTRASDGVMDAIHRQGERIKALPNHFGAHYLFRTEQGVISSMQIQKALKKLAPSLHYEARPYQMTAHQFRHTIATDMIEQGIDIYTVKEFLGHASLAMTEQYVKVYLKTLKAKYDAYRAHKEQIAAVTMLTQEIAVTPSAGEADGGWVEGRVGTLYHSPLPNGIGTCVHLAMLDPCPTPPVCDTCPKLQATRRHLPVWENKVQSLLITVEALRENPIYARARQKHEQELAQAERVAETIRKEGFWDGRIHNTHQPQS